MLVFAVKTNCFCYTTKLLLKFHVSFITCVCSRKICDKELEQIFRVTPSKGESLSFESSKQKDDTRLDYLVRCTNREEL